MIMPQWIKPGIFGAVVGAIALAIVGFTWMGWVTDSSAEQMAIKSANAAVVKVLVPICIARAQHPDSVAALEELNGKKRDYERRNIVEKAGWSKMPGDGSSNRNLAEACARALKDQAA